MAQIDAPRTELQARVDPTGQVSITVDGTQVLDPSPISIPGVGSFPDEFAFQDVETNDIQERYALPHGKTSAYTHLATDATFRYRVRETPIELQVRVATDGVAYRYRYPGDEGTVGFLTEGSGFAIPEGAIGYVMPYVYHHEASGRTIPVREMSDGLELQFPALFEVAAGTWVLLCEAGVDGQWAAGRLTYDGASHQFDITHPRTITHTPRPATSPWRVAIVGDLGTIVESTLPTDLVDGPLTDPDWVEPGRVAWSWWSTGTGDLELGQAYVDFASEHGWEHVLIDAGWDADWMLELIEYAAQRDVGVFVWTHFTQLNSESKRASRLSKWAEWGVAGIKVDFMDAEDQGRLQFYDALAKDCAIHELMVNFHGSVIPTGLRRRWPHIMSYEGVMGAEKHPGIAAEHNTILPFTRNVVGPMDYTPVTFSADSFQTPGHELALAVVFESGLQHLADSIETYRDHPLALEVLEEVAAAWDETRFLRGRPGSEATIARRKDTDWFVGCISAGPPRSVEVPLDFIDTATEAIITRDGSSGTALEQERRHVEDSLRIAIPEQGGFVIQLPASESRG